MVSNHTLDYVLATRILILGDRFFKGGLYAQS